MPKPPAEGFTTTEAKYRIVESGPPRPEPQAELSTWYMVKSVLLIAVRPFVFGALSLIIAVPLGVLVIGPLRRWLLGH